MSDAVQKAIAKREAARRPVVEVKPVKKAKPKTLPAPVDELVETPEPDVEE